MRIRTGIVIGLALLLAPAPEALAEWIELGGSGSGRGVSNTAGASHDPTLKLDSQGNPHIAWDDATPSKKEIYYTYWNGSTWAALGGSKSGGGVSNNSGGSAYATLDIDSQDRPHIAWYDYTSGNAEIYYAFWNGSAWAALGGSKSGGGVSQTSAHSFDPSLAVDSQDRPHIAWYDKQSGIAQIYYAYWNGSTWAALGGSKSGGGVSNMSGGSSGAALVLDSQDRPHIAWQTNVGGDAEIFYAYWNGSAWVGKGGSFSGGGITNDSAESKWATIDLDSQGNACIGWSGNAYTNYEVYLKCWTGSAWAGLGGSDVGRGLSQSGAGASRNAVVIDSDDRPHVSWYENKLGEPRIFYLHWTGSAWETKGTQGELGNNVYNFSHRPPIVLLTPDDDPNIAWEDYNPSATEVYFKRWDDGSPPAAPAVGLADYDDDGKEDIALFRNGMWYGTYSPDYTGVDLNKAFGSPIPGRDIPQIAELNCLPGGGGAPDGKTDLMLYRKDFATWQMSLSPNWPGTPAKTVVFGTSQHAVTPTRFLDLNGDGCNDIAVYGGGCFQTLESPNYSSIIKTVCFGQTGDQPLGGDLNGDGISDLGLFQTTAYSAKFVWTFSPDYSGLDVNASFGNPGDVPLVGEMNGDGMHDLGVYRPSSSSFFFTFSPDFLGTDLTVVHGVAGDEPILADLDGDGLHDIGIYRPNVARWHFLCSPGYGSTCMSESFGIAGDVPVYRSPQ